MSRLITFGCSNTYGHGLEDCITEGNRPGPLPSKFAWPVHLGNMLGLETINMARPGASNLEILCNILKFEFQETDTVITLWTEYARDLVFIPYPTGPNGMGFMPIGTWMTLEDNGVDVESWLKIHTDYDLYVRSLMNIHHAEVHLENKKIKNKSFSLGQNDPSYNQPDFLKINNLSTAELWNLMYFGYDKAPDGHPGPIAHKKIAEKIYKHINE